jgi:F-type H+-transporting ATPase subunit delta
MRLDPEVADRYGSALFSLAKRQELIDRIADEGRVLLELIPRGSKVRTFLEGPQFNIADQLGMIERAFKGRISDMLVNLLKLLIKRHRIFYLEEILKVYNNQVEEHRGIYSAEVFTAVDLDVTQKASLNYCLEQHTGNRLKIKYRNDPKIIGGVIFRFKDLLIDDSVRTRLCLLRQRMLAGRVR